MAIECFERFELWSVEVLLALHFSGEEVNGLSLQQFLHGLAKNEFESSLPSFFN